jgi:osomolarity two-component system response regulator SKN7
MDMMNGQLVAMQQQLQTMQERNYQLETQYNILLNEFMGMTKTVLNHDHVLHQVMGYLNTVDAQRRRDSRIVTPFHAGAPPEGQANQADQQPEPVEDDTPASPLLNAAKLMSENHVEALINPKNLEQINQISVRAANGTLTTPPPDFFSHASGRPSSRSAPNSATSSNSARFDNIDHLVYPVGVNNGIDPMYSEHIHNIPYAMPAKTPEQPEPASAVQPAAATAAPRKKSLHVDPGWIRQPQILLVEDDPTCRRIGGKFLYAFSCSVDLAVSVSTSITQSMH